MNLSFYIAKRYLVSKKKTNLINIISAISIVGLAIGTMGLIIGLSGFNGFDNLIKTLFSSFDPDLNITPAEGKYFSPDSIPFRDIRNMPEVAYYSEVIEDNALLRYDNREVLATVKGVSREFQQMTGLDTMIIDGEFKLRQGDTNYAVIGQGVAYYLSLGLSLNDPIDVYVPKKGRNTALTIEGSFNLGRIYPAGIFQVQQEIDNKYIIVPIEFARELFESNGKVTSIELKLKEGANTDRVQKEVSMILGNRFIVKNRYQQHEYLYKTMEGEKFATYLILILILIIASFNIIGSLTMLIIDKKEDIAVLQSMGADKSLIRKIFLLEGWSISIIGSIIGTIVGIGLCKAQMAYGFVKLKGGSSAFVIDSYPIKIIASDIVLIFLSVILIGFIASWLPAKYISSNILQDELH